MQGGRKTGSKWGMREPSSLTFLLLGDFHRCWIQHHLDVHKFEAAAKRILEELEKESGWMYTTAVPGNSRTLMEYTV